MSPMDPRLSELKSYARMWDGNLYWLEDPEEISLEIIPPTHWVGPGLDEESTDGQTVCYAARASSQSLGAAPPNDSPWVSRASQAPRDATTECKALAFLAAALINAVHTR
jgi:hypothetical protein